MRSRPLHIVSRVCTLPKTQTLKLVSPRDFAARRLSIWRVRGLGRATADQVCTAFESNSVIQRSQSCVHPHLASEVVRAKCRGEAISVSAAVCGCHKARSTEISADNAVHGRESGELDSDALCTWLRGASRRRLSSRMPRLADVRGAARANLPQLQHSIHSTGARETGRRAAG